jgi:EF-hand domain-containing protein 1
MEPNPYASPRSALLSLASCVGSLIPTVPKAKLGENKTMRFMAKMESTNPEDVERVFTISFFLVDNTVQIHEPPKRNSGIVGGSFLSRMKLRTAEGLITQEYFYVGAEIQLAGHAFILVDADDGTLRHMENNSHIFEYSNLRNVVEVYGLSLKDAALSGELLEEFKSMDVSGTSTIAIKSLKQLLMKYKCSYYYGGPPEQAVLTLCRKLGNKTSINYEKFVAAIVDPNVLEG